MKKIFLRGGTVVSGGVRYKNPGVGISDGVIRTIGGSEWSDAQIIAADGHYIIPGMIDMHTHGAMRHDFTECSYEAFSGISAFQVKHGVTSLVASLMTMPIAQIERCARMYADIKHRALPGASVLGLHFEGPFLSVRNRGAQSEEHIAKCEPENYKRLLPYCDVLKMITFSPESDAATKLARAFSERGVLVSGGHDDGSEPFIEDAIKAGMSHSTHLFCAMSSAGWHNGEKQLGLTEMSLLRDDMTTEIIADGAHTSKGMVMLAYKCKGADKLCLVSDMLSVGGLPASNQRYVCPLPGVEGGLQVIVTEKAAVLYGSSLNAGSVTPLDKMLKNVISYGIPIEQAVLMATRTPARILREKRKGEIRVGMDADICIMNPDMSVYMTLVDGSVRYVSNQSEKTAITSC